MMSGGSSYCFQIVMLSTDTHTLLATAGAAIFPLIHSKKDFLELVHPSVREKECWIVLWNEGAALDSFVISVLKIPQKYFTKLVGGFHSGISFPKWFYAIKIVTEER